MSIELHWAQKEASAAVGDFLQAGEKKIYVDMPTRTRKTGVYLHMLERFAEKGILPPTTIVTDRKEQVRSILKEAKRYAPTLFRQGAIQAHTSKSLREAPAIPPIRVMTYMGRTAAVLDGTLNPKDEQFLVEDEAQHALSELRLDTHHRNPDAFHVAFTSSPEYSEEKGLPQAGYKRAYKLTRQRAVDGELNSHIRNVVVEMENVQGSLDDISYAAGDYAPDELEKLVRQTEVMENMGNFMEQWHSPVDQRPIYQRDGFIFCNSIADAVATAEYLNKRFGKNTGGAVWGAMSDGDQDKVLRAHEHGDIKFLASANFAVEGFGKDHHDVVINRTPTRSAVRAEQRGGRVTGFDESNPDKEGLIADLMYPAEKEEQLTYGDAVNGYLFEKSSHYQKGYRQEKGEPNTMPTPMIEGLTIHAIPSAIETFAYKREIKRREALSWRLRSYTDPVRKAMVRNGLLSVDAVWSEVQKFMDTDIYRKQEKGRKFDVGKFTIKNLMLGNGYFEHPELLQYSDGAIALAAAFRTAPKALFGSLNPYLENGDKKPLAAIKYKTSELTFHDDDIATPLDEMDGREGLDGFSFEHDGYNSAITDPVEDFADEDQMPVEEIVYQREVTQQLPRYLEKLEPRIEYVLRSRFGLNAPDQEEITCAEMGAKFNMSGGNVSALEGKALGKLNRSKTSNVALLLPPSDNPEGHFQQAYMRHSFNRSVEEANDNNVPMARRVSPSNDRASIPPKRLAVMEAVVEMAKSYRRTYEHANVWAISRAIEAFADDSDEREWKLSSFRNSHGYDAKNIIRLIDEGFNWDIVQEVIDRPISGAYDYQRENAIEYRDKAKEVKQWIQDYRESGKSLADFEVKKDVEPVSAKYAFSMTPHEDQEDQEDTEVELVETSKVQQPEPQYSWNVRYAKPDDVIKVLVRMAYKIPSEPSDYEIFDAFRDGYNFGIDDDFANRTETMLQEHREGKMLYGTPRYGEREIEQAKKLKRLMDGYQENMEDAANQKPIVEAPKERKPYVSVFDM